MQEFKSESKNFHNYNTLKTLYLSVSNIKKYFHIEYFRLKFGEYVI